LGCTKSLSIKSINDYIARSISVIKVVDRVYTNSLEYKEDWMRVKERFKAWWEGELKEPLIQVYTPRKGMEDNYSRLQNTWIWGFARNPSNPQQTINTFLEWCKRTIFFGDMFPNLWVNLGAGIVAGYLGAKVVFKNNTVWIGALGDPSEVRDWETIDRLLVLDEGSYWWRTTVEITRLSLINGVNKYITAVTDLGGIHDVLASLRGTTQLIKDMYFNAKKVDEAAWKLLDIWHSYYDKLYDIISQYQVGTSSILSLWSPRRWYPIQCDLAVFISPKLFEKFIAPILSAQCDRLDHVVYHLDGPEQINHLDHLLKIEKLHGFQWVPGARMEKSGKDCGSDYWLQLYNKILNSDKRLVISVPYDKILGLLDKLPKRKGIAIHSKCRHAGCEDLVKKLMEKLVEKKYYIY